MGYPVDDIPDPIGNSIVKNGYEYQVRNRTLLAVFGDASVLRGPSMGS